MRIGLTRFSGLLLAGLVALMLAIWSLSVMALLERQNRQGADAMRQAWQGQVLQLQEKQRLWLQSQFYLLAALAESPDERRDFQSFVLQYYQRNPEIWAVNLLRFAPIADELKALDEEIVINSTRFRWRDIRNQLKTRIRPDVILTDFLSHSQ